CPLRLFYLLHHFPYGTAHVSSSFFSFYCSSDHRDLHSFPTRRSSDLWLTELSRILPELRERYPDLPVPAGEVSEARGRLFEGVRSEEHTSELQSRFDLVCRLLLEKKKKKTTQTY